MFSNQENLSAQSDDKLNIPSSRANSTKTRIFISLQFGIFLALAFSIFAAHCYLRSPMKEIGITSVKTTALYLFAPGLVMIGLFLYIITTTKGNSTSSQLPQETCVEVNTEDTQYSLGKIMVVTLILFICSVSAGISCAKIEDAIKKQSDVSNNTALVACEAILLLIILMTLSAIALYNTTQRLKYQELEQDNKQAPNPDTDDRGIENRGYADNDDENPVNSGLQNAESPVNGIAQVNEVDK